MTLLRDTLRRLFGLRLAAVAALSFALLALPCSPLGEALRLSDAAAGTKTAHYQHNDADAAHHANRHENECCTNCTAWLTALTDDGTLGIIIQSGSSGDIIPADVTHLRIGIETLAERQRSSEPPSVAFIDGSALYSKTQRYRI